MFLILKSYQTNSDYFEGFNRFLVRGVYSALFLCLFFFKKKPVQKEQALKIYHLINAALQFVDAALVSHFEVEQNKCLKLDHSNQL